MSDSSDHTTVDPNSGWAARYLRDMIYGAMDGAVTTFAVVSGVTGAGLSPNIVIVLGVAGVIGDGFSMAAGNYLGTKAEGQRLAGTLEGQTKTEGPIAASSPKTAAISTFVAFLLAGTVPLLPYVAAAMGSNIENPAIISTGLTLTTFFAIGAGKALVIPVRWLTAGLESLAVGTIAAALAYGSGAILGRFI